MRVFNVIKKAIKWYINQAAKTYDSQWYNPYH